MYFCDQKYQKSRGFRFPQTPKTAWEGLHPPKTPLLPAADLCVSQATRRPFSIDYPCKCTQKRNAHAFLFLTEYH